MYFYNPEDINHVGALISMPATAPDITILSILFSPSFYCLRMVLLFNLYKGLLTVLQNVIFLKK